MIYIIEQRKARDAGSLVSWYEVRQYTHRTNIGVLANGETLAKVRTKKEAREWCKANGIEADK